jgi:uncharacterized protein (TIGR03437 family)
VATKTSFLMKVIAGLCLCLGMAGGLLAQSVQVTITGTLGPYTGGTGEVTSGFPNSNGGMYVSGITATGTKEQYCLISYSGNPGGSGATAKVFLPATYTTPTEIPGQTIDPNPTGLQTFGSGYTYRPSPTAATVIGGTATCTGSSVVLSGVQIDDSLGLVGTGFTAVATLSAVDATYTGGATATYSSVPLTLTDALIPIPFTCMATVTVTASSTGNDILSANCRFNAGNTEFTATGAIPSGTIPAPIPLAFSQAAILTADSGGSYTPGSGSTFDGDVTDMGVMPGANVAAVCSGCPTASVTSATLNFAAVAGGSAPAPQPDTVNTGGTVEAYAATPSASWITVGSGSPPAGGSTGTPFNIGVNPAGLPPGNYSGTVNVYTAATNVTASAPLTIAVNLMVTTTLVPAPTSFTFNSVNSTSLLSQNLSVTTSPSSSATYGAAASTTSGGNWLSVSSATGTAGGAAIAVMADPTKVPGPGTYSGTITLTTAGATNIQVPVTFNVTSVPTPAALTFTGTVGGATPATQPLSVTATGPNVTYTAAVTSGSWLSVSPGSGTTNGAAQTVSVNISGLSAMTYHGTIAITPNGAAAISVPVTLTVGSQPSPTAAPSSLSFNYTIGGTVPGSATVTVGSSGAALSNVHVGAPTVPWFSVSQSGTTTPNVTLTVSLVQASLPATAGSYSGSFAINATGATPLTYQVMLTVLPQPALTASPTSLSFTGQVNAASPAAQTLSVNSTNGSVSFTAVPTSTGNWLSVKPASGATNASLQVSVNTAGLATGKYTGSIVVTASAASGSPVTIPVSLSVTSTPALIATPATLSFSHTTGAAAPAGQSVAISTSNGVSTAFTSTTNAPSWLQISPTSGAAPSSFTVNVVPGSLPAGNYNGIVTVSATGFASATVAVTLTVSATPPLTVTPASLAFSYQIGGATPASQSFAVASGNVPVNFTVASPGNWLQVNPSHGTTPQTVMVTANPAGLAAGSYGGTIMVTAAGSASSVGVAVTLTVTGVSQLTIAPSQLTFAATVGGTAPASQTLAVTSAAPLGFAAASGSAWLSVTPTSGTTPATLTVSVNLAGLAAGTYNGAIDITPAGSAVAQAIMVTLQVGNVTPTIAGIINAASGAVGMVSPGMAISIFGAALGPQTGVGFVLPPKGGTVATTLGGTQVLFDNVPVPVLFTVTGQVNALVPFELSSKTSTVLQVVSNGATSAGMTLPVVPSLPGLFTANASGKGEGAILNQDSSINSASNPAAAGSTIQLFGTGGGVTIPPSIDGALNPLTITGALALETTATVGGQPAFIYYSGPAPNLVSGIIQVDVTLPEGTPSGNVPVVVTIACPSAPLLACGSFPDGYTASSQTMVTVAVQ